MRRFRHWFQVNVVSNMLNQAQITFELAKACADSFNESIAPLYPLTLQLSNEQAQAQIHWMAQRRKRLEEQLTSNPADSPEDKNRYRTVRSHSCDHGLN